jgi:hypothetical protein
LAYDEPALLEPDVGPGKPGDLPATQARLEGRPQDGLLPDVRGRREQPPGPLAVEHPIGRRALDRRSWRQAHASGRAGRAAKEGVGENFAILKQVLETRPSHA